MREEQRLETGNGNCQGRPRKLRVRPSAGAAKTSRRPPSTKAADERTERVVSPYFRYALATPKWNRYLDAYKRLTPDNTWKPPRSPYSLLQEDHYSDPWRVLVICMLLNRTTGRQAERVLQDLFCLCPNARAASEVSTDEIERVIQSLGLQKTRARKIQRMSIEYLKNDWSYVTQLHGIGKYAADAYAIFCSGRMFQIIPDDHMLNKYWGFFVNERIKKRLVRLRRFKS